MSIYRCDQSVKFGIRIKLYASGGRVSSPFNVFETDSGSKKLLGGQHVDLIHTTFNKLSFIPGSFLIVILTDKGILPIGAQH